MRLQAYLIPLLFLLIACNSSSRVKTGREAFDAGRYSVAVELLRKEIERTSQPLIVSEKAFLLGRSYEKMNEPDQALIWFRKCAEEDPTPRTKTYLAYALKNTGRYAESKSLFEQIGKDLKDGNRFRNEIVSLMNASDWVNAIDDNEYKVFNTQLNSKEADYGPAFDSVGRLVFTSDRMTRVEESPYLWTGRSFSTIFVSDTNGTAVAPITGLINTDGNEGSLVFAPDHQELTFCRCYSKTEGDLFCKLYNSRKKDGMWSEPVELNFISDTLNYIGPAYSSDGNTLFFSMEDPALHTGFDIYYAIREGENWSQPVRLPFVINSDYNEKFVTIDRDTMYFSSDNPNGMGGLDIYKTYISRDRWVPPINLKAPINSSYDDFSLVVNPFFKPTEHIFQKGFFTSNRRGGAGQDDIYGFARIVPLPEEEPELAIVVEESDGLLVRFNLLVYGFPVENDRLSNIARPLSGAGARVQIAGLDTLLFADRNGQTSIILNVKDAVQITASMEGYLTASRTIPAEVIRIDSTRSVQEFTARINLYAVAFDQEIVIRNVYYDLDKYDIRADAIPALDELLSILENNPEFKIRIAAHTDCRGTESYNLQLSENRAKSVVTYLVSRGIAASRLSFIGYGESRPVNDCPCEQCDEAQHQANRRTTFQLVR